MITKMNRYIQNMITSYLKKKRDLIILKSI